MVEKPNNFSVRREDRQIEGMWIGKRINPDLDLEDRKKMFRVKDNIIALAGDLGQISDG